MSNIFFFPKLTFCKLNHNNHNIFLQIFDCVWKNKIRSRYILLMKENQYREENVNKFRTTCNLNYNDMLNIYIFALKMT